MEKNPEYFSEIVYLRSFAILAVISAHVSAYFMYMDSINFLTLLYMSIDTFSHFAIPLFVCISGFVLFNKYQGSYSLNIFYKKRFLSVVPQYTIFSILGILFIYVGSVYSGKVWNLGIRDIIYQYFTGTTFYHLWFFILIIQLYILYPIIEKIFAKSVENHKTLGLLIFLLMVQIVYQIFSIKNIFLIGTLTQFLGYTFYFVLGMYIRSHYLDYKNTIMNFKFSFVFYSALLSATVLGIGIWCFQYFENDLNPQLISIYEGISAIVAPFYYILILVLCSYIAVKFSDMIPNTTTKGLKIIGNYSFQIFLIHAYILLIFTSILLPKMGFNMSNWLFYPVIFTVVLSLSLVIAYILNKVPYHEYVIGNLR
jgi:probable poly-beta-1,6-N-acetyl-D-glucosamine export protein